MIADSILQTIGNTPHVRINRLFGATHKVYVKSKRANPGGSIKDRIAVAKLEVPDMAKLRYVFVARPMKLPALARVARYSGR